MTDENKRYPKSLTAPVTEELWTWFSAQADAEDRTIGAHLRRLIQAQYDREQRRETLGHFAGVVEQQIPVTPSQAANAQVYRDHPLLPGEVHVNDPLPPDDDPEEGVT